MTQYINEMPTLHRSDEDGLTVRLETRFARSVLTPSRLIRASDAEIMDRYARRYRTRRSQGYPIEDAVVLALMDCCVNGEPSPDTLANPSLIPRLIDEPSRSQDFLNQPDRSAFATLTQSRPGPYPIVSDTEMLHRLLDAGAGIIQLRVKTSPDSEETNGLVKASVQIAARYPESQLFINDHWRLAIAHGAYGVHLGQEDLCDADLAAIHQAGLRLGLSSHAYWEVARAMTVQPSYIACGPIFPTRAKAMPWIPQGIRNLIFWSRLIPHPVIGIGGVTLANLPELWATGCDGVAMIAAVTNADDPASAMQAFNRAWQQLEADHQGSPRSSKVLEIAGPTLE